MMCPGRTCSRKCGSSIGRKWRIWRRWSNQKCGNRRGTTGWGFSTWHVVHTSKHIRMFVFIRIPYTRYIWYRHILYIPCSTYFIYAYIHAYNSPPARWGLLDFMSVAWSSSSSSSSSSHCPPRPPAQLRLAIHSVLCRTSTTTIHAQCSLPDLNHDHPRPVFPAGPQPRPSTPSVPCRTSTASIHAQCSLPDLNREYPRQVFPAGPHVGRYAR